MTLDNISWSISTKECCQTQLRSNPRPPDHQSDMHPTDPLRTAPTVKNLLWELHLKERICSLWEQILSFKSSSLWERRQTLSQVWLISLGGYPLILKVITFKHCFLIFSQKKYGHHCSVRSILCWGLTTRQPLWVILCRLPEKGRKEIEEIVEEMKERNREERGTGMIVKKQKK